MGKVGGSVLEALAAISEFELNETITHPVSWFARDSRVQFSSTGMFEKTLQELKVERLTRNVGTNGGKVGDLSWLKTFS
ncbi:hypothetical protein KIN20_029236 [Parelaphostrongylus tenuis]|uniref:Uncharacterized protein n=1 Tax=Parelaphostrongylus tenuis TaxID=148309 RepID=A0AAD5R2E1_PARTN|nr:hypothetical protein KIN20_029236 [Parelaphostrongylus tenuis]